MAQDYSLSDVAKLRNDKEVVSRVFSKRQKTRVEKIFADKEVVKRKQRAFESAMLNFLNSDMRKCDLRLVKELSTALGNGKPLSRDEFTDHLILLRINHNIDDIFFEILHKNAEIAEGLAKVDLARKPKSLNSKSAKLAEVNELETLFEAVSELPNEKDSCLLSEYAFIYDRVLDEEGKPANNKKDFRNVMGEALKSKLITLDIYNSFRYLAEKTDINERDIWLNDYLKITFNAKNKMIPIRSNYVIKDISLEDDFASKRIRRFSEITRRRLLYRKYNETQIILLSQLLQKASRRMGADPDTESKAPIISQEFSVLTPSGERETYVESFELDAQSQYNLARRLLRKDMTETQMMDLFSKVQITHEDIVMAGLETGYISLGDLEYVVAYDDLWNPSVSKFEKVTGFIFRIAGYSSFFLPPPWNITATIVLGIAEGIVNNKNKTGVDNDNPATFIE